MLVSLLYNYVGHHINYSIFFIDTDGQKIAKKLCLQISKETKGIQTLVKEYNALNINSDNKDISHAESLDPLEIQGRLQKSGSWSAIADGEKRGIIDHYLMYCRCEEEQCLLLSEVDCVVNYYQNKASVICKELEGLIADHSDYSRGVQALLKQMLSYINFHLKKSKKVYSIMTIHQEIASESSFDDDSSDNDMDDLTDYTSSDDDDDL